MTRGDTIWGAAILMVCLAAIIYGLCSALLHLSIIESDVSDIKEALEVSEIYYEYE